MLKCKKCLKILKHINKIIDFKNKRFDETDLVDEDALKKPAAETKQADDANDDALQEALNDEASDDATASRRSNSNSQSGVQQVG